MSSDDCGMHVCVGSGTSARGNWPASNLSALRTASNAAALPLTGSPMTRAGSVTPGGSAASAAAPAAGLGSGVGAKPNPEQPTPRGNDDDGDEERWEAMEALYGPAAKCVRVMRLGIY